MPDSTKPDAEAGADAQSKISIGAAILVYGAALIAVGLRLLGVEIGAWVSVLGIVTAIGPWVAILAGIATFIGPKPESGWIRLRAALGIGLGFAFLCIFWIFGFGFWKRN